MTFHFGYTSFLVPRLDVVVGLFMLAFFSFEVLGAAPLERPPVIEKVVVGVYVIGIHSIDIKAGTVDLDLYLWLRTRGERNLLESIEIMNGTITGKASYTRKKVGDETYHSTRISIKTFQNFDLRRFPLDKHNIMLLMEDSEEDNVTLQFVPDVGNTKVSKSVMLPGWQVGKAEISVNPYTYDTNYGDLSIGENTSIFSRVAISLPIDRNGIGYFFKLFGTMFLAAAVAFLSFFIRPDDLDPRFGLGVGGIFAVVASNFVLTSMLPETHQVTMGEALLLLTMVSIFLAILESVISLKLWESNKQITSVKLDSFAGWIIPIAYLLACGIIIAWYPITF